MIGNEDDCLNHDCMEEYWDVFGRHLGLTWMQLKDVDGVKWT